MKKPNFFKILLSCWFCTILAFYAITSMVYVASVEGRVHGWTNWRYSSVHSETTLSFFIVYFIVASCFAVAVFLGKNEKYARLVSDEKWEKEIKEGEKRQQVLEAQYKEEKRIVNIENTIQNLGEGVRNLVTKVDEIQQSLVTTQEQIEEIQEPQATRVDDV